MAITTSKSTVSDTLSIDPAASEAQLVESIRGRVEGVRGALLVLQRLEEADESCEGALAAHVVQPFLAMLTGVADLTLAEVDRLDALRATRSASATSCPPGAPRVAVPLQ